LSIWSVSYVSLAGQQIQSDPTDQMDQRDQTDNTNPEEGAPEFQLRSVAPGFRRAGTIIFFPDSVPAIPALPRRFRR
jgi:hypothetical protein